MSTSVLLMCLIMIPVLISLCFIPYWTRRTESFGVSIPEKAYHLPELKKMRKQYAWIMAGIGLAVLAMFVPGSMVLNDEESLGLWFVFLLLFYLAAHFLAYLIFHRKMKALKQQADWGKEKKQMVVVDTSFRQEKLTYSHLWFLIPFSLTLATLIFLIHFYERIPEKIPMQYDFNGKVTRYAEKSYRTVLFPPVMQVYLTLLFLWINIMIGKAKQQISAENPGKSIRQNVIFRRRWSLFTILSGTAVVSMFSLSSFSWIHPVSAGPVTAVSLVITIGILIAALLISFTTGQGGSRVKAVSGKNGDMINRDDDQYWKLGQFYFNKNDPAIFVEKRFGIGWTNNWAHPLSWIFILLVIGLAFAITYFFGN
ncbi:MULTISPECIES: DUF1648 domain-containing protein [Thermoactinomyces]|uniref:DUF1648 domain-containing protein n=1 Tax=Thermoactinomyces vulgaris TaxID=2026 RepID=A0ABS0QDZ9_THEVU|nr:MULTISPECIES: DUF5808 domain-containing protein [Thermoactinomyces]MBH8582278.1 DUF1648 domain-containing protein [Thermoactinomyces sp. CICC 10735]MBH8584926.1 DUF1648 domain-containing protein [Thermoactinomyces sp. CICC 10520]MBI0386258.1 DUF1648 domain-containing protein [Thermoactinomyces sp. CICC 24227]MBI0391042.1 DUF1648 domain-containing protein [Thermoactinomyces sp. CICC 24226]KFZ39583.1 hypothetical protein JS81_13125 [Thermoactinomyces sp. Gus2-1]